MDFDALSELKGEHVEGGKTGEEEVVFRDNAYLSINCFSGVYGNEPTYYR